MSSSTLNDSVLMRIRGKRAIREFNPKLWINGSYLRNELNVRLLDVAETYPATLVGFTSSPRSTDVPTVLAGKCKSIVFGSGKYATTSTATLSGQTARTIACWFKRNGNPTVTELIYTEAIATTGHGVRISVDSNGRVSQFLYNGSADIAYNYTGTGYCDNAWHFFAVTWDGTTNAGKHIVYIDSAAPSTATAAANTQGDVSTYEAQWSGYNGSVGTEFDGSICRPQIWAGTALTAANIATLRAGGDVAGATAEWRGMESDLISSNGDPVWQTMSRDTTHVIFGQPTLISRPTYTAATKSVTFAGTNDYLTKATPTLTGTTTGRIQITASTSDESHAQVLYSQSDTGAAKDYLWLGISSDNMIWYKFDHGDDLTAVELKGSVPLGTGMHVLEWATDGSAITMFVDGSPVTIDVVGGTNAGQWFGDIDAANNSTIGASVDDTGTAENPFTGTIAEIVALEPDDTSGNATRLRRTLARLGGVTLASGAALLLDGGAGFLLDGGAGLLLS